MSFDRFYLRKSLYLIGQNMGKTDVGNLKFLCDYDLPKRHLEKIETAFELFCALEEANIIDVHNQTRLIDLLQTLNKGHLLRKYPLHAQEDPVETDRGGQLPSDHEKKEMLKFLLKISNDMSNRDLRNLICFVYDLIPDNWTLINMDSIQDGSSVFKALITARLIGPKNMKILEEIFEVIGRNDLCQKIRERPSFTQSITDTSPVSPPYDTNSMSSYASSGQYSRSNYSTSSSDESGASVNSKILCGQQMSLDHGGTTAQPSAPPTLQSSQVHVQSPQQPMTASFGHGGPIIHGGARHYYPYNNPSSPNAPPPNAPSSLPLGNGHILPTSSVSSQSMGSNPYQVAPQPETFGQSVNPSPDQSPMHSSSMPETVSHGSSSRSSHVVPTVSPAQPPMVSIEEGGANHGSMPVLVSQSEQGLIQQLEEKEQQLRESDKMKAELLATMEFQRELMNKLMHQEKPQAPPQPLPPSPQPNQYPMKCSPHGLAIIIGNDRFTSNKNRPKLDLSNRRGCDLDVMNFENLFGLLRYDYHIYLNQTAQNIESIFEEVAKIDHSRYDSFVMCITTHGESNSFIFGSDSVSLDLYALIKRVQTCPSLFNKPKLFFVQACRMPREDVVSADSGGRVSFTRNVEADVYIAWATSRNQAAYRSQQDGSWFVSALNHVFVQYAQTQDLVSMMYEVTRLVTAAEGRESGTNDVVQQCVETNSQLRGPVRFL